MTGPAFSAFAAVHADHQRPLWAYLVRLGATPATADDLTQETFMRWLDRGDPAALPPQTRAFLFTTATRLLTDRWRRERRYAAWDAAVAEPATAAAEPQLLSGRGWHGLSARERQLLWLAYGEEFTHAEIATITGLAAASVRVLLARARERLKTNLVAAEDRDD